MSQRRPATILVLAALAGGCGTNKPELPADLGEPDRCARLGYPEGPYGTEPGDVLANACFQGWSSPDRTAHAENTLEPLALADFHDPDGTRGIDLLLINTAALWCSACRIEHETLPQKASSLAPRGLVILTALFQDNEGKPADLNDMTLWVETFGTNFPIVLDPSYSFGIYASAETAPLNLVVDPRTMTITRKFIGDQAGVIWPLVDGELTRRANE